MKKFRPVLIYLTCLAAAGFFNSDRLCSWLENKAPFWGRDAVLTRMNGLDHFAESLPPVAKFKKLDCLAAPIFSDTYKSMSKCSQPDPKVQLAGESFRHDGPGATGAPPPPLTPLSEKLVPKVLKENFGLVPPLPPKMCAMTTRPRPPRPPGGLLNPLSDGKIKSGVFMIIGDSMANDFSWALGRMLNQYEHAVLIRKGKASSGLVRRDFFDWESTLEDFIREHKPDHIVIMIGANDPNQTIKAEGVLLPPGTQGWGDEYRRRVKNIVRIVSKHRIPTYWVGLPIMRDTRYAMRVKNMNGIVDQVCSKSGYCHFFDTWDMLADENGAYRHYIKTSKGLMKRIRRQDGIHFTTIGSDMLNKGFIDYLSQYVELRPKNAKAAN